MMTDPIAADYAVRALVKPSEEVKYVLEAATVSSADPSAGTDLHAPKQERILALVTHQDRFDELEEGR